MSYLDLLKLAAPEAIVTLTALVVLVIGLTTSRGTVVAGVSVAMPKPAAAGTAAATRFCTLVGALGLIIAIEAIVLLPRSEERRVGKEGRSRRTAYHYRKRVVYVDVYE